MQVGKLNLVMDGQWGSTGKGKLCYYLALKHDVRVAVCDFQTNAGHTIVTDSGEKFVFQQLPVSALKKDVLCLINPGATITVQKLLDEIEMVGAQDRLVIHPNACIVTDKCREMEAEMLKRIASTLKGVGAALGMKAMRHPDTVLAKDVPELSRWVGNTTDILLNSLASKKMVLGEGAQGFDLSINHGYDYPFVTSRDITPAAFLSNAGVPVRLLGRVYGCLRAYPIRVGNHVENGVTVGSSGPYYDDQREITWEELATMSGSKENLEERTTVTKKVRRVFTFSMKQIERFIKICAPDSIFLNFINHLDVSCSGLTTPVGMPHSVVEFISNLNHHMAMKTFEIQGHGEWVRPPQVEFLGTGPMNSQMIELGSDNA